MAWAVEHIEAVACAIHGGCRYTAGMGVLPGEGLGGLVGCIKVDTAVSGLTDGGHWVLGHWLGTPVVAWTGRNRSPEKSAFVVRTMKALGVRTLLVVEKAWALTRPWAEGDLMLVADHINALGDSPLVGPNDPRLGPRFPDMSRPYCAELLEAVERAARDRRVKLNRGVYLGCSSAFPGSADDLRVFRGLGADVYGRGIVSEALTAAHAGLRTAALAAVVGGGIPGPGAVGTIFEAAQRAVPALSNIIESIIETSSRSHS